MRIKALRAKRKITQAERTGISHGYLARRETGRREPTITTLEALRVPVERLLS